MILITGCPRSGTSMLGELFEYHPGVRYHFEVWNVSPDPIKATAVKNPAAALQLDRIYSESGHDLKVIYIIRDPRDTVCSLINGLKDGWGHRPNERIKQVCEGKPIIAKCAWFWREHVNTAMDALIGNPCYVVKYEEFVANPMLHASSVLSFCGLPWDARLNKYLELVGNEVGKYRYAKGSKHPGDMEHTTRVGRYKQNLTADEIKTVERICLSLMEEFGYAQD